MGAHDPLTLESRMSLVNASQKRADGLGFTEPWNPARSHYNCLSLTIPSTKSTRNYFPPWSPAHRCTPATTNAAGRTVYEWEQNMEEVNIWIKPPEGVKSDHLASTSDQRLNTKHQSPRSPYFTATAYLNLPNNFYPQIFVFTNI